jgi:glycosyltransferase involved in cell wall biosynthesis
LALGVRLAGAWVRGTAAICSADVAYVGLGQTSFALMRDGVPLLAADLLGSKAGAVVSLNGNLFAEWEGGSLQAQFLRRIVHVASYVTVLGPQQRDHMIRLGIPARKVIWMDNTCDVAPITRTECLRKHSAGAQDALRILYLSNLLESKGYPEFVAAIRRLVLDVPIEATLCGPLVHVGDDARFASPGEARRWIGSQITQINASRGVRLRWIEGAYGAEKEALFRQAHVFVLPTRYPVEAQPLTILEALASGCAVVTTKAGEIPSTVSEETAVFLDDTKPEAIAQAIVDLARNAERRTVLALNGLALFRQRFAYERHIDRWEQILMQAVDRDR